MADVDALAAALVNRFNVAKGDRVAIAMRNLPEWVVAYGAVASVGAVSVSLNAWWTEEELDYALYDSAPRVLHRRPRAGRRTAGIACRRLGVRPGGGPGRRRRPDRPGVDRFEDVLDRGGPRPEVERRARETTPPSCTPRGRPAGPKGPCRRTGRSPRPCSPSAARPPCAAGARRGPAAAGERRRPVFILIVPLFHVTGCIPVMLSCVAVG